MLGQQGLESLVFLPAARAKTHSLLSVPQLAAPGGFSTAEHRVHCSLQRPLLTSRRVPRPSWCGLRPQSPAVQMWAPALAVPLPCWQCSAKLCFRPASSASRPTERRAKRFAVDCRYLRPGSAKSLVLCGNLQCRLLLIVVVAYVVVLAAFADVRARCEKAGVRHGNDE